MGYILSGEKGFRESIRLRRVGVGVGVCGGRCTRSPTQPRAVGPDVKIKSWPIFPKVAQNGYQSSFCLEKCCFPKFLRKLQNILGYFCVDFGHGDLSNQPNLVTLAASTNVRECVSACPRALAWATREISPIHKVWKTEARDSSLRFIHSNFAHLTMRWTTTTATTSAQNDSKTSFFDAKSSDFTQNVVLNSKTSFWTLKRNFEL